MTLGLTGAGIGQLPVSGPGTISSVTVTDARIQANDIVIVTKKNEVRDQNGPFDIYAQASPSAGSFVAYSDKEQLPSAMRFNWASFTPN